MMPSTQDILDLIEEIAPSHLAEPWDNAGLQVGTLSMEISKIYLALDPTMEALNAAFKRNAQILLTHHPLIFKPLSALDTMAYPGSVIAEAVRRNIQVVSAHTNLDAAKGGINDILAELLGLHDVAVLEERNGFDDAGFGRIGDLPEPCILTAFTGKIRGMLGTDNLKVVGESHALVKRVAVVGGSGGALVSLASRKGADLLLTGDVAYHQALEARALGLVVIDGGHFFTEKTALRVFGERLRGAILARKWRVLVEVDESESNPSYVDWGG